MKFKLLQDFVGGKVHTRLKPGKMNIRAQDSRKHIQFKREWYQPIAWVLDNVRWSRAYFSGDKICDKRKNSITYVELACVADVLTGGAIGPREATFDEKAQIFRQGMKQLMKGAKVSDDPASNSFPAEKNHPPASRGDIDGGDGLCAATRH